LVSSSFCRSGPPRPLPSFPTRRSSDLTPPLEEFLQQISLYSEQDSLRAEQELVTLMTLHNAKGLEYDTVFIVGCEDGAFPHMRRSEEHTSELQSRENLVCRLLLEKKNV